MSDPASLATLDVLTKLSAPANFISADLVCVILCRAANLSLERGHSDGSCVALALIGMLAAPRFGDYQAVIRLAQLGYELVERRGLKRFQAETYIYVATVMQWTQHPRAGRDLLREAFTVASRSGNLTFASLSCNNLVSNLLAAGVALHDVQREAEHGLAFARNARFGMVIDIITSQLGLIRTLRGLTPQFGCFDEGEFNELHFEGHLADRPTLAIAECWYWIRKLQAHFFADDHAAATHAASMAQRLLWTSPLLPERADYHYYAGLSRAAQWDTAPAGEQPQHLRSLAAHHEQLEAWAANCPENFENRAALVGAEIARIEGRDLEAMRLYEEAIRSARANGFIHNEALANEVASRFYATRGFEKIARVYLQDARYGYLRWGADGKVRQLDRLHPGLAAPEALGPTANIGSSVQLDVATVVKASQAVSSEIVLAELIERLMTIALVNAGADRGLLILPAEDDHLIQAEAKAAGDQIEVVLCQKSVTGVTYPESIVRYVIRTHESVILDDAAKPNIFSDDDYLRGRPAKSILCLPLIKQGRLTALLYLENTLTSHAFTPDRIAILELLAAQAAISLENTRLYSDLQEREAKVRRLVESNIIGISIFDFEGRIIEANEALLHMVGHSRDDIVSGRLRWTELTPTEWQLADERAVAELRATGSCKAYEKEYFRNDGSRVPVLVGPAAFDGPRDQGVCFVLDLTERKEAEQNLRESERRYRESQMELAHVNRVTTMGQLTASIAHEVNQPIAAAITSADAGLRWLAAQPPDLEEVRDSFDRIIKAGNQAGEVIRRIRALVRKVPERKASVDVNETILETIDLTRSEIRGHRILLQTELAHGLPRIWGERVQLQQVILNLIMNAIEAMQAVTDRPRKLAIGSHQDDAPQVVVTVQDCGAGISAEDAERLFDAFFTTKASGMGMGLSICRSIIEAHGGRLSAANNAGPGATFQFTLSLHEEDTLPGSSHCVP
jgi:PAS domain S-box-containing protein